MIMVLRLLIAAARSCFRSRLRLETENLILRHQINILRRAAPSRVRPTSIQPLWFVLLYRLWPDILRSVTIIRPETVVRWHRQGWRAYWRWKSRGGPGRPKVAKNLRDLIREISLANPLSGAPRIHGELLKLGIAVGQSTVSKYMPGGGRPSGQTWWTFLRYHAEGIASIDLFVVPTITFKRLFGLVVLRHDRREIMSFAITIRPRNGWRIESPRHSLGIQLRAISFAIATAPTAQHSSAASNRWASETDLSPRAVRGRIRMSRD